MAAKGLVLRREAPGSQGMLVAEPLNACSGKMQGCFVQLTLVLVPESSHGGLAAPLKPVKCPGPRNQEVTISLRLSDGCDRLCHFEDLALGVRSVLFVD